jgi:hypothetical protein
MVVIEIPGVTCAISGCGRPIRSRGYCNRHHLRLLRYGHPLKSGPNKNRLIGWLRVARTYKGHECLEWPFSKDIGGYGQFKYKGFRGAHRVMCYLAHGEPPIKGCEAAHSCRSRSCVSPNHLSWKTLRANRMDKVRDGTHLRGERNHKAKLSSEQVRTIRKLRGKVTGRALAARFGVTPALISRIYKKQCWAWLE